MPIPDPSFVTRHEVPLRRSGGPPAAPTGLAVLPLAPAAIQIQWDANTEPAMSNGAGSYELQTDTDPDFDAFPQSTVMGSTKFNVLVDFPGIVVYARVRAIDAFGRVSPWSSAQNGTLTAVPRVVSLEVSDPNGSALTTGDGKKYLRIPALFNGRNIVAVGAHVTTASSSGAVNVQVHRARGNVDVLSTALTIDASEQDSVTAATPAVINTSNDDVATGDEIRIDVDGAGTGAKGLLVDLTFQ